jgi:hypothetical protein
MLSCNFVSWQYILRAREKRIIEQNTLALQPWTTDQIAALVRNCCEAMDTDPDFSKVVIPRQFDFSNSNGPYEKTFSGFIRLLHVAAMGNPKVALALWAKSLYINKYDKVAVRLPNLPYFSCPIWEILQSSMKNKKLPLCSEKILSFFH